MITQIEIGGYRLLDEFKADLNPLTVVIGANAVGKSTLSDGLQLIAECCDFPLNTAMGWHWGAASLLTAENENGQLAWSVTFCKPSYRFRESYSLTQYSAKQRRFNPSQRYWRNSPHIVHS